MNDASSAGEGGARGGGANRALRRHLRTYAVIGATLFLIDLSTPGPWWFYWPALGWGIAVAAHWLYVKSITIDDEWAAERTAEIRQKAYDLGHIEDIETRYEERRPAPTTRPDRTGDRE
jgi:hypothetical protein